MAARPLVEALGAVAWCMGAVGRGAERVKRWIVPREAFVGNLANEDIDERPVAGERVD